MELILLFLEKILEAIYFSIFLIIGKRIKEKRILFTLVMIFEYVMLTNFIEHNVWFQLIYTFMSYINLKVFYKEKAQITDIFLFAAASILLIAVSGIFAILTYFVFPNYLIMIILLRVVIFTILFVLKNKIAEVYKSFYSLWNRHNKPKCIKSLTLRNISIIIFNLMFYIINIAMLVCVAIIEKG